MIENIILSFPSIACLLALLMVLLKEKDSCARQYSVLMFFGMIYFVFFAIRNGANTDYVMLSWINLLIQGISFAILPSIALYTYALSHTNFFKAWMALLYVPAVVQLTLACVSFFALGVDNVVAFRQAFDQYNTFVAPFDTDLHHFYYYVTETQLHYGCAIGIVMLLIFQVWVGNQVGFKIKRFFTFFTQGTTSTTEKQIIALGFFLEIMLALYLVPPHEFLENHPFLLYAISIFISVDIYYIGFCNLLHQKDYITTLNSMTNLAIFSNSQRAQVCPGAQEAIDEKTATEMKRVIDSITKESIESAMPTTVDSNIVPTLDGGVKVSDVSHAAVVKNEMPSADSSAAAASSSNTESATYSSNTPTATPSDNTPGDAAAAQPTDVTVSTDEADEEETSSAAPPIRDIDITLFEQLTKAMNEEQLFLQEDISMEFLVERLRTNRTYLSRVIKQFYQVGFREYVNLCRIEYSMAYMKKNPNDTLEYVAMKCGYPNAQTFSRKFKEISGKTPRQWLNEA